MYQTLDSTLKVISEIPIIELVVYLNAYYNANTKVALIKSFVSAFKCATTAPRECINTQ